MKTWIGQLPLNPLEQELAKALDAIMNLCNAPHWNTDRKHRIRDIATEALRFADNERIHREKNKT